MSKFHTITGRAVVLNQDNIDTDRIIPARFLKCVTFDELGAHVFEDDRALAKREVYLHSFDDPANQGASLLFTGSNFGSGSSREHAVHALMKWGKGQNKGGIKAIIASGPYSEIFFGNSLLNGLPAAYMGHKDWEEVVSIIQKSPNTEVAVDIEKMQLTVLQTKKPIVFQQPSAREAFISGSWDKLGILLQSKTDADKVIKNLPYII